MRNPMGGEVKPRPLHGHSGEAGCLQGSREGAEKLALDKWKGGETIILSHPPSAEPRTPFVLPVAAIYCRHPPASLHVPRSTFTVHRSPFSVWTIRAIPPPRNTNSHGSIPVASSAA